MGYNIKSEIGINRDERWDKDMIKLEDVKKHIFFNFFKNTYNNHFNNIK